MKSVSDTNLFDEVDESMTQPVTIERSTPSPAFRKDQIPTRLARRNGQIVDWNSNKIEVAVRKAFLACNLDSAPAVLVSQSVEERVRGLEQLAIDIETVQDIVQEELMRSGHFKVAESYIVYRARRAFQREHAIEEKPEETTFALIEAIDENGAPFLWDGRDLRKRIEFAREGLNIDMSSGELDQELRRSIGSNVTMAEIRKVVTLNAKALMEKDSDFAFFAARILLTYIYEECLNWSIVDDGPAKLKDAHIRAFKPYLNRAIELGRLAPDMLNYDVDRLANGLDPAADLGFDFLGIQTLYDRYLLSDKSSGRAIRLETPQMFWLRVSMGIFRLEPKEREERVLELYSMYKDRRFCSSTPTLFNAGTQRSQLSSCYLYKIDDSLESIVIRGIAENAMLSKWAGGLGGSWTAVRGTGAYIQGTNGESQGIIPFLKMHNDQLVAVNQGGKRAGSGCAYLESWHSDIFDFLELRRNTGDERRRTHDMNTANWIPDLFMKRMEARGNWTLFQSNQVADLHDLYGKAFEDRYEVYEGMARRGEIYGKEIPALDLWKKMLQMIFETGHPWITFKDACNIRSPQDHVGVIHSSNLCTEITLNTSDEETAVCNLGSVILDNHLLPNGELDHPKLRETIRVAVRALDNVIDINFYPTEPARVSNTRHRPIGMGVMGLQYALYKKGVGFATQEALEFNDEFMEAIAYYAYEASSDLAAERGAYSTFKGSKWDRGLMPQDTLEALENQRGETIDVPRGGKMDWQVLRDKIKSQGMRNSNVLAIAPTATIANIMGTSPCIEPMYKNMFAKSNLSGDFMVVNPFLVQDLKKVGLWKSDIVDQLKYFDGELDDIAQVPSELKERYVTAFKVPFEFLIDAAARRQKWIDQSQSVNLFLGEPDMKALSHMYRRAWRTGLKTTYYLRTLGASNIEKATVSIKKSVTVPEEKPVAPIVVEEVQVETLMFGNEPKRSFTEAERIACSIDAMRNGEECEACQ